MRDVFVLGLTDVQRGHLTTIRNAAGYRFHSLLDVDELVKPERYDFEALLSKARAQLEDFHGSVDAIIAHWDFPTSVLAPVLAREHGLPSPSLESVLTCEHKYWSRLEQSACVSECVPAFTVFDPFDDDAADAIDLPFPLWIKPVKSFASQLGFQIRDREQLQTALERIRRGIGRVGPAFDQALELIDVPEPVRATGGTTCLAEQMVTGSQSAPEGSVFRGEFAVHGVFDMLKDDDGHSFQRLEYPSVVPEEVSERMSDICERYLRHIGYDNGCFNAEFMWDRTNEQLWLIEVNTRISQSHSDLFAKVDGMSNHEVAVDVALGQRPSMPYRQGRFAVAAQCHVAHQGDAIIRRAPTSDELERLAERHPETVVELIVREGDRLADLRNQDAYRFDLAVLYLGANRREDLVNSYRACLNELRFEFEPVPTQTK